MRMLWCWLLDTHLLGNYSELLLTLSKLPTILINDLVYRPLIYEHFIVLLHQSIYYVLETGHIMAFP